MDSPHILLISLDTVRRDHLGCYGHPRQVTPHLDRIADGGVRCADSIANCGWTLPQHATLLTGLYPLTHGCLILKTSPPLAPRWRTLAEQLREQGYQTITCVTPNAYGGGAKFGLDRGFDVLFNTKAGNRHMELTVDFCVEALRERHADGPCFLYVHVNDTHEPWQPPEPWIRMWGGSYHNRYEAELSYVDHHLGRLFAAVREMGIWDDTVTVVFSDHGTEFFEHGFYEKKVNLYNEILHVPLLFHYPARLPTGRVVDGLVESADVAPTILDVAGLPPLPDAQGTSLLPRFLGQSSVAPEVVCSHTCHNHQGDGTPEIQFDHYAVQTRELKLIRTELHVEPDALFSDWKQRFQTILLRTWRDPATLTKGDVVRELYDLVDDPGEHRTLVPEGEPKGPQRPRRIGPEQAKAIAADLEARLDRWIAETRRGPSGQAASERMTPGPARPA